jgi:hypothetical protein
MNRPTYVPTCTHECHIYPDHIRRDSFRPYPPDEQLQFAEEDARVAWPSRSYLFRTLVSQ